MKTIIQFRWLLILLVVFSLGLAIRLYRLDSAPRGALIDEAHFGYIARSLLLTGKDEHGVSWPVIFKGFGDQKLPGYAYVLIPFIAVLDLSVFSIRLPSMIVGSLSVLLVYALARQLKLSEPLSIMAALITALSPWSFFLSRIGFESNLALFFWLSALTGVAWLMQQKKIQRSGWLVSIATALLIAGAWYSYIAYRPVTFAVLAVVSGWMVFQRPVLRRALILLWLVLALSVAPLFHPAVSGANTTRLKQVGLLSDPGMILRINESRTFCAMRVPLPICSLVWNKGTFAAQTLVTRFFHTYSPEFLATHGEVVETFLSVKGFGQFSVVLYPFFLVGLCELLFPKKKHTPLRLLLLVGLLLAPIPTIIAGEPQKVRISALFPFVLLTMVVGIGRAWSEVSESQLLRRVREVAAPLLATGLVVAFLLSSTQYFFHYFLLHSAMNDYQYQSYVRDIFPTLRETYPNHRLLIKPFFSDPTMFYAFYTKMDPTAYQQQAVLGRLEESGFQHTIAIDGVEVWEQDLLSASCQALQSKVPTLYMTNIEEDGVIVMRATSENGVLGYAFVYDALRTGAQRITECNDIPVSLHQSLRDEFLLPEDLIVR